MMRRRVGRPLLRTAAVGAAGYAVGSSAARNSAERQQQEAAQDAQIAELQQQATMAQQGYPPTQQGYPPTQAYSPQPMPPVSPQAPAPAQDPVEKLRQLGELKAAGVLTQEEFDAKKAELLKQM